LNIWRGCNSVVVKALCYNLEGRGFVTRWGNWISSIYFILPAALGPGIYSACSRYDYHKRTKVFLGSRARPVCEADNLTAVCGPNIYTMWDQDLKTL
jgi:hypothetical protein